MVAGMEYITTTMQCSNGCRATIIRPVLTEEEMEERKKEIYKAAERLMKNYISNKRKE